MNGIPLVPRNSRLQQTQQNKISGKLPVDEEETEAPGENDLATDKEIVFFMTELQAPIYIHIYIYTHTRSIYN